VLAGGVLAASLIADKVVPVQVHRDVWDWVLFGLAVLAAAAAAVALLTWWSKLRRIPEVGFRWQKPGGGVWMPEEKLRLPGPGNVGFRVALDNVGAAAASLVVVNVMVPDFLSVQSWDRDGKERRVYESSDVAIGCPPDHNVRFFVVRTEEFVPAIAFFVEFSVTVQPTYPPDTPRTFYFAVSAESEGFSRSGHRCIPSFGLARHPEFWSNEEWPGKPFPWWPPRQIKTRPRETVRAGPGRRIDRRPVVLDAGTYIPAQD